MRDYRFALFDETALLDDTLITTLSAVGPLTVEQADTILKEKWIFHSRYGHALSSYVHSLKTVFRPIPPKPRASKRTAQASASKANAVPVPPSSGPAKRPSDCPTTIEPPEQPRKRPRYQQTAANVPGRETVAIAAHTAPAHVETRRLLTPGPLPPSSHLRSAALTSRNPLYDLPHPHAAHLHQSIPTHGSITESEIRYLAPPSRAPPPPSSPYPISTPAQSGYSPTPQQYPVPQVRSEVSLAPPLSGNMRYAASRMSSSSTPRPASHSRQLPAHMDEAFDTSVWSSRAEERGTAGASLFSTPGPDSSSWPVLTPNPVTRLPSRTPQTSATPALAFQYPTSYSASPSPSYAHMQGQGYHGGQHVIVSPSPAPRASSSLSHRTPMRLPDEQLAYYAPFGGYRSQYSMPPPSNFAPSPAPPPSPRLFDFSPTDMHPPSPRAARMDTEAMSMSHPMYTPTPPPSESAPNKYLSPDLYYGAYGTDAY